MSEKDKGPIDGKQASVATEAPPAEAPKNVPTKERMQEQLPPKMVEGLKEARLGQADVLATKSYPEQKLWRVVTKGGQKLEISFEGKFLNPPKPKVVKPKGAVQELE